jgi:DNA-binding NtrC family response regulator
MDALFELSLVASDNAAAPCVLAGPAQALPAFGIHSLREFVEQAVAEAEAQAIGRALTAAKGNKSLAARILQTNYTTLHTKMKRFKISAQEFRRS